MFNAVTLFIIALFKFKTENAHHHVFCSDLVPPKFSVELLGRQFSLIGSSWDTIEKLTSDEALKIFQKAYSPACLASDTPDPQCTKSARTEFIEAWKIYTNWTPKAGENTLIDRYYYSYRDQQRSGWTQRTAYLFHASCLVICSALSKLPLEWKIYNATCPNPCKSQTSCPLDRCHRTGLFSHEFFCFCAGDELWDPEVSACIPNRIYQARRGKPELHGHIGFKSCDANTYCDKNGTMFCQEDVENKRTFCTCKPQYHGTTCTDLVDACAERIQHPYLPNGGLFFAGSRACNVNQGKNLCRANITSDGDPVYSCECDPQEWEPDPNLPYENCLKRRSTCDMMICVRGKCVSSFTGRRPHCECEAGYSGPNCDEWTGEWTNWSPWDRCRPACGDIRYSIRFRDCKTRRQEIDDQRDCVGSPLEYWRCDAHPCARGDATFLTTYFSVRQNAITSGIANAAVACGVITVIWGFVFRTALYRPLRMLFTRTATGVQQLRRRRTTIVRID
ncbi:hypothetical protein CSKR_107709 [Clonorchis sinensis]|uniref:Acidic fibroblast growth factor intracellular binding protein n=2 Tax=Clonorchis sinensis TaxID=79923 RepID=G7YD33_CLOSI|nr:hypothetical protein CSKR_107709 [Clonorchis sinensis]GAA50867.1 acidic fibroblast growth factor intracellular binding protein [Clonorchis sinensis]